ncbi:MAG: hypothetical protein AAF471_05325 [Myxococcota bacterium]
MSVWRHLRKAILIDHTARARVTLTGPDHLSLLHRLSTQACDRMQRGQSCLNALLTPKGRLVDLVHQILLPDGSTLLVGGRDRQEILHDWLDQHIFTENARVADARDNTSVWLLTGNGAGELLGDMFHVFQRLEKLLPWQYRMHDEQLIMRTFDHVDEQKRRVPTWLLRLRGHAGEQLLRQLREHRDVHEASEDEATALRIGAGIPGCPNEINDHYNPLELGLDFVVNRSKGCYVGQEIISRLLTYNKVRRRLVRVRGPRPFAATPSGDVNVTSGPPLCHPDEPSPSLSFLRKQESTWTPACAGVTKGAQRGEILRPSLVNTQDKLRMTGGVCSRHAQACTEQQRRNNKKEVQANTTEYRLTSVSPLPTPMGIQALAVVKLPEPIRFPIAATVRAADGDPIDVELLPTSLAVAD